MDNNMYTYSNSSSRRGSLDNETKDILTNLADEIKKENECKNN
jgi:hypothetical protein